MKWFHRCSQSSKETCIFHHLNKAPKQKNGDHEKSMKWYRRSRFFRRAGNTKLESTSLKRRQLTKNDKKRVDFERKTSYDTRPITIQFKDSNECNVVVVAEEQIERNLTAYTSQADDVSTDEDIQIINGCTTISSVPSIDRHGLLQIDPENTPLHCACFLHYSSEDICKALEKDPDLSKTSNKNGELPLHYACLDPLGVENSVVDTLLASYPQGAMCENADRSLPLHLACLIGSPSQYAIKALLYANPSAAVLQSEFSISIDPSNNCENGQNSLNREGIGGNSSCASTKDIIEMMKNGTTALSLFYNFSSQRCASRCNGTNQNLPPSYGHVRFDGNCTPRPPQSPGLEQGWTAIHLAALSGSNIEVLKTLLEYGPEMILSKTSQGRTPVDCAAVAIKKNFTGAKKSFEFLLNFRDAFIKSTKQIDKI